MYVCIYIKQCFFLLPSHPLKINEGGLRNVDNPFQPMQPHPEEVWTATVACPQPAMQEELALGRSLGGRSACTWGKMTRALSMSLCKPKPSKGQTKAQQLAFEGHPKLLGGCFFFFAVPPPLLSLLSVISSSSITQTPNITGEAVQLYLSRLQLAPE